MEAHVYSYVKQKVRKLTGVDLNCYKSQQMQRRLGTFLLRSRRANWPSLFRAIQNDPVEQDKLRDYLTINVSSFFRDPEKFTYLRESVLPRLLRGRPRLRVWSAGCSYGHEPYSLAIALAEATNLYCRHFILATDIDRSALARARAGGPYSFDHVRDVPPHVLARYFRAIGDEYHVVDSLRKKVAFCHHDLLVEPFECRFDLIVCRNVVIYFTEEVKEQLYKRFYDALRPGGVLFVGGTEVVSRALRVGFEPVGISFYARTDAEADPPTGL
jgi:chemotaxis protein methyltransferase CheR